MAFNPTKNSTKHVAVRNVPRVEEQMESSHKDRDRRQRPERQRQTTLVHVPCPLPGYEPGDWNGIQRDWKCILHFAFAKPDHDHAWITDPTGQREADPDNASAHNKFE